MIKVLKKVGMEGMHLNIITCIFDKPIANIILNREKLKHFLQSQELHKRVHFPQPE
jgi:hypothetical protein